MNSKTTIVGLVAAIAVLSGAMGLSVTGAFSDPKIAQSTIPATGFLMGAVTIEAFNEDGELIAYRQTITTGNEYILFDQAPVLFGVSLQIHHKLMIIVPSAVLVWVTVTFLTKPEPTETLTQFYERVHPGGWWEPIASKVQSAFSPVTKGFFLNWIAGICFIHGLTFAIGHWLFGNTMEWIFLFILSTFGFIYLWHNLIKKLDES